ESQSSRASPTSLVVNSYKGLAPLPIYPSTEVATVESLSSSEAAPNSAPMAGKNVYLLNLSSHLDTVARLRTSHPLPNFTFTHDHASSGHFIASIAVFSDPREAREFLLAATCPRPILCASDGSIPLADDWVTRLRIAGAADVVDMASSNWQKALDRLS